MDRALIQIRRFIPKGIFRTLSPIYHWYLALMGSLVYGFPSRGMKVIGVTGTSGKTTTVEFLHEIFERAGYKTASLSGLRFRVLNKEEPNMLKMTMPGRFKIQRFLSEARRAGVQYVFLEVTSEGIRQYRHKFINFYAAILTNLSPEHLESHGGFAKYRAAKAELFLVSPVHVLNGDDENFEFFNKIPAREKVIFRASDYPNLKIHLEGEFNRMNAVSALSFANREHIPEEISLRAVEAVKTLPGRMEFVETRKNFKVLVDYAFLPQALRKVYETLNKDYKLEGKRLVCVTGAAGGGRDKWKRPVLGDVAAEFCKKVIVTNEDPYDENPMDILKQVEGKHNFEKILDRREAIRDALKSAEDGDIVVITGKGAEPWIMGPQGTKTAWDDRVIVREELSKL
ncbi:MAG TPA: Mur ligase family protein [Candidatus Paceibacterota bacterium]|nr:Mur ligase family protein [Candidatus Paceibacterota bacterium]